VAKELIPTLLPHYQSQSLIFQFVLAEFLKTNQHLEALKSLCDGDQLSEQDVEVLREKFTFHLKKLGYALPFTSKEFLPWSHEKGIFVKLEEYTKQLLLTSKRNEETYVKLHRSFTKCTEACYEAFDHLQETLRQPKETICHRIFELPIKKITTIFKSFGIAYNAIPLLFKEFNKDENVILFLINHYDAFERIYTKPVMKKLFDKINAKGVDGVKDFVLQKYSERGFETLIPLISEKLNDIEFPKDENTV
jgi:hypothetical protein